MFRMLLSLWLALHAGAPTAMVTTAVRLQAPQDNDLALHYSRGTVRIEVRVSGGRFKAAEMQSRLLKLRRVP